MEKLYFQNGIIKEKIFINDDSSVDFYCYYYNDDIKKYVSSYNYSFKTENKNNLIERYKARGFGSYREIKEKMDLLHSQSKDYTSRYIFWIEKNDINEKI